MSITIEELDKVLQHKNIVGLTVRPVGEAEFARTRDFCIEGQSYSIEWWKNICYLLCGQMKIPFDEVVQSNTWPNRSKLNLQFSYYGNTCCIIPIEYWEEA